jgi:hypothetical protein
MGRHTLTDLSIRHGLSIKTLRRKFDRYQPENTLPTTAATPVALTLDATFFGRGCGLMIYRAEGRNIHWQEIESETLAVVETGLKHLREQGWHFSSVTVDGRKGTILLINRLLPDVPVQFCLFHQKAIIRRYLTAKPKTLFGKELRSLTSFLGHISEKIFMECLDDLRDRYADFLKERNEQKQFKHRRLRSALRSLRSNAPYLFAYQRFPDRAIPTTTNSCDGSFAHWKNKVKIHRGLKAKRRQKMIRFLLSKS